LLVELFVCEAGGTVDYWWGLPEVRLLPPGYLVGGFVAGVGWLVDYSTGEMTQIRDCQLNLVYD